MSRNKGEIIMKKLEMEEFYKSRITHRLVSYLRNGKDVNIADFVIEFCHDYGLYVGWLEAEIDKEYEHMLTNFVRSLITFHKLSSG